MHPSRRQFIQRTLAGVGALTFPNIIPARVLGAGAPSKKVNILQIGCGRIARSLDLPGFLKHNAARVVAVCDLDSIRVADTKQYVERFYAKKNVSLTVAAYGDYREALQRKDVDAVAISTPDHWHAQLVVEAVLAGKDIYVQKPLTMTHAEGCAVSDLFRQHPRVFQIGSQRRSSSGFRQACEVVRNGRIGKLQTVKVGLPTDPSGGDTREMPVPPNLNYDRWLGPTPLAPYNDDRVHSQNPDPKKRFGDRPGWLRIEDYCLGMITGHGAHYVDIAQWGMGTEMTGPIEIEGRAEFPTQGLWNVHGAYHVEAKYANGVTLIIDNTLPSGVRFEGSDGWVWVTGSAGKITASDPAMRKSKNKSLDASNPDVFTAPPGPKDIHLHASPKDDHHLDWITSLLTRQPTATSPEQAHRSTTVCIVSWIAMKLGRKLRWDPQAERFIGDDSANALLTRAERTPYGTLSFLKKV
ncbi:MAG: Gfo/Idh/MocA family oxidoreductase [Verrucomicrobiia bacterium]|jgi:predicted dehydrogenase